MRFPQLLIVFPLGLLGTSFFFDLAWLAVGRAELAVIAWWLMAAGVIGGIAAALLELRDWAHLPRGTRARRVGAVHNAVNGTVALLFAASWLLRRELPAQPEAAAIVLSALGALLCVVTGWVGGELAEETGGGGNAESGEVRG